MSQYRTKMKQKGILQIPKSVRILGDVNFYMATVEANYTTN